MLIKNKKAMSISILVLVVLTLVLCGATLVYLQFRQSKIRNEIYDVGYLGKIYSREAKIDFYVNNMMEFSIEDFSASDGKQKFIENFKIELNKHKTGEDFILYELNQIEDQLINENIELNENNVSLKLNINIQNNFLRKDKEILFASYDYEKVFEKVFK